MRRTAKGWTLAGALLLTAGCGGAGLEALGAAAVLEGEALDYGLVEVGYPAERTLVLDNQGDRPLDVRLTVEGPQRVWFTATGGGRVPAKGTLTLTVAFRPLDLGAGAAELVVETGADRAETQVPGATVHEGAVRVPLAGVGFLPAMRVEPATLDFGEVVVNSLASRKVKVTNDGEHRVPVHFAAPAEGSAFGLDPPAGAADGVYPLEPGESVDLTVTFEPPTAGVKTGVLGLRPCQYCSHADLTLLGTGILTGLSVEPAALAFGDVNPGEGVLAPVIFHNRGNLDLQLVGLAAATQHPAGADAFRTTLATLPLALPAETDTEVLVAFTPDVAGDFLGALTWETTDPNRRTGTVSLSGRGGGPDVRVTPTEVDFGLGMIGAVYREILRIHNVGDRPLTVQAVEFSAGGPFGLEGEAAGPVAPGEAREVVLTFTPQALGPASGGLVVRTDDRDTPEVAVALVGTVPDVPECEYEVSPGSLWFGTLDVDSVLERSVGVTHRGTAGDCLLTRVALEAEAGSGFQLLDPPAEPVVLAPGRTHFFRVRFSAVRAGTDTGVLRFRASSAAAPEGSVGLFGAVLGASVFLDPGYVDFGPVETGCAAARQVCLYNRGTSPVRLQSARVEQAGAPPCDGAAGCEFSLELPPALATGSPVSVSAGGSICLGARYAPADLGPDEGAIALQLEGLPGPAIVPMAGTGVEDGTRVDTYVQAGNPQVDVLFVMDDSGGGSFAQHAWPPRSTPS